MQKEFCWFSRWSTNCIWSILAWKRIHSFWSVHAAAHRLLYYLHVHGCVWSLQSVCLWLHRITCFGFWTRLSDRDWACVWSVFSSSAKESALLGTSCVFVTWFFFSSEIKFWNQITAFKVCNQPELLPRFAITLRVCYITVDTWCWTFCSDCHWSSMSLQRQQTLFAVVFLSKWHWLRPQLEWQQRRVQCGRRQSYVSHPLISSGLSL